MKDEEKCSRVVHDEMSATERYGKSPIIEGYLPAMRCFNSALKEELERCGIRTLKD